MKVSTYLKEHGIACTSFGCDALAEKIYAPQLSSACDLKTVLLRADHGFRYVLAVLPSHMTVNQKKAAQLLGGADLEICDALEYEMFCRPDDRSGLPPFGSQFGLITLVDSAVTNFEYILIDSDEFGSKVCLPWEDFVRLEHPYVGEFAEEATPTTDAKVLKT